GFLRRGRRVHMLDTALDAVGRVDSVETVIVVPRLEPVPERHDGPLRILTWPEPRHPDDPAVPTVPVEAEHPLFIAYTPGTTGKPKGSVHVHAGFTVKIAEEVAFQFDCRPGDRLFWFADFG